MQMSKQNALLTGLLLTLPALLLVAQESEKQGRGKEATAPNVVTVAGTAWAKGPPSLPAGAQMAVLDGNTGKTESVGATPLLRTIPWKMFPIAALLPGFAIVLPDTVRLKVPGYPTPAPACINRPSLLYWRIWLFVIAAVNVP